MPKLPVVSGEEAIRALERLGFKQIRQRGSHVGCYGEGKSAALSQIILNLQLVPLGIAAAPESGL